jgi:cell division septal protein FtsQ
LKNYPQISQADIKKKYPGSLLISVRERGPVAFVFQNDDYFYIDTERVAFEKISQPDDKKLKIINSADVSEIQPGSQAVDKSLLEQILKIESKFTQELKIQPKEAIILSEQRLNIKTAEGWEAYFNLKGDLDWQITELEIIIQNKIDPKERTNLEYIDLRFDRVFVFPEGLLAD